MSSPETSPAERLGPAVLFLLIVLRLTVSPSIYPWTGAAWSGIVILVCALLLLLNSLNLDLDLTFRRVLTTGAITYCLAAVASGVAAFPAWFPFESTGRWSISLIGSGLLFVIACLLADRNPRVLAASVVASACLSAAFGLRQRLGGFQATLAADGISEYARQTLLEARIFGLTFSPDLLAATIAGALPLALTLLLLSRRDGRPAWVLLSAIATGLLLAALALTRSLGGTIAAFAGLGLWLLTVPPLGRRARVGLLIAGAVIAAAGMTAVVIARGGHLFNWGDWNNPLVLRLDNWRTALAVWREFPLTGAGPGQYGLAMLAHRSLCGNEAKHVHNLFLETLAELGPVGMVGLVLMVAAFFVGGVRSRKARPEDPLPSAFFASGTAILVHSMMDFSWQTPEVAAIFWAALAGVSLPVPSKAPAGRMVKVLVVPLLALVVISLFLISAQERRIDRAQELAREQKWREVIELVPPDSSDSESLALAAQAYYQLGDLSSAEDRLGLAIQFNPRNPFYYSDLAMMTRDPAQRLALMRQAVERYPNSAPLNAMLGRVLVEQGRLAEAEKVLRHGASVCREGGDAMTLLGMLCERQGRMGEAEDWLRRGAQAEPSSPAREQALQRFLARRAAPTAPAVPPAP